jgi:predicted glycogen debranching enzyme
MLRLDFLHLTDSENFQKKTETEWLETNGLGGYASSSLSGLNTRGYHGLLIASNTPPTERHVLVARLDESLILNYPSANSVTTSSTDSNRIELALREYAGNTFNPNGSSYLQTVSKETHICFLYKIQNPQFSEQIFVLKKEILCPHGEQRTIIRYTLEIESSNTTRNSSSDIGLTDNQAELELELRPFMSGRSIHARTKAVDSQDLFKTKKVDEGHLVIAQSNPDFTTHIQARRSQIDLAPDWYYNLQLNEERMRGYEFSEDLFSPATITLKLTTSTPIYIVLSANEPFNGSASEVFESEIAQRQKLIKQTTVPANSEPSTREFIQQLALAADQFIVKRANGSSIIAGYPWFDDWGRDAMIALPGLCLSTKRFADAREILETFAANIKNGLIPNRFLNSQAIEYNTVDASLWFIIAAHEYYKATGDLKFVRYHCLNTITEIIEAYSAGTDFEIKEQADGLLSAGSRSTQLTWMDARIERLAVTPRNGKPVEVNALWYNALKIAASFNLRLARVMRSRYFNKRAKSTLKSFNNFWFEEGGYLYDVLPQDNSIAPQAANSELRPNQIFALSLPFTLVDTIRGQRVLQTIENQLLTPVGLRTLNREHPHYCEQYRGDVIDRDLAYHQGTAWLWLMGPYLRALKRYGGNSRIIKTKVTALLAGIQPQLLQAGFGSLSEVFDAEAPHTARGCFAQAWSVGEVLRELTSK